MSRRVGARGAALLALACLAACSPESRPVEVRFTAAWGDDPLACAGEAGRRLTDLRFFVSGLAVGVDGRPERLELEDNGRWQGGGVTLVDLEDGSGSCTNGTGDQNAVVVGRLPPGDYRGVKFDVGVPFEANHADPLAAAPPLDDSTMHWHWRSGYKFLRAGFADGHSGLSIHLGSAGCEGAVGAIRNCRFPNRARVSLPGWRPGAVIAVDLRTLAERARAASAGVVAAESGTHCESAPGYGLCRALLPAFGLDPEAGVPAAPQELFRVAGP